MDIEDIDVFIGIDVGKAEHWATALSQEGRKVLDRTLPNDEERLRALYKKLADHGNLLVVVDQPATIGALAVAVAQDMGITVGYLPGLSMWTAGGFSDSACFVLQAAFFRSRKSLSTSFGVRYPRAE